MVRVVAHVDLDAFFASVELRDAPHLRGRPVVVGSTVVAAASYEARRFGVRSATPMSEARRRCRDLVVLTPDLDKYREASAEVFETLGARFGDAPTERLSIDEAFVELTEQVTDFVEAEAVVAAALGEVRSLLRLPISAGVASSKLVAKMASGDAKPDGLLVVPPGTERGWLAPKPASSLFGVGPKTAERLESIGVRTVADLSLRTRAELGALLGPSAAERLSDAARGVDRSAVTPNRPAKSFSTQKAFSRPVADVDALIDVADGFVVSLCRRVSREGRLPAAVSVKVRDASWSNLTTRSLQLQSPSADPHVVVPAVRLALRALPESVWTQGVTLLGVGFEGLGLPGPKQPTVLAPDVLAGLHSDDRFAPSPRRVAAVAKAVPLRRGVEVTHPVFGAGVVRTVEFPQVHVEFASSVEVLDVELAPLTVSGPPGSGT